MLNLKENLIMECLNELNKNALAKAKLQGLLRRQPFNPVLKYAKNIALKPLIYKGYQKTHFYKITL